MYFFVKCSFVNTHCNILCTGKSFFSTIIYLFSNLNTCDLSLVNWVREQVADTYTLNSQADMILWTVYSRQHSVKEQTVHYLAVLMIDSLS